MEADTVVLMITIVGSVLGSTLATIGLLLGQMNRLDDKFEKRFGVMGRDIPEIRESLARVEGFLMAPHGFTPSAPQPPATVDPPPEEPGTGQRQAG